MGPRRAPTVRPDIAARRERRSDAYDPGFTHTCPIHPMAFERAANCADVHKNTKVSTYRYNGHVRLYH
jgi:hypothetical protein